jgi:hypothetical protein
MTGDGKPDRRAGEMAKLTIAFRKFCEFKYSVFVYGSMQ